MQTHATLIFAGLCLTTFGCYGGSSQLVGGDGAAGDGTGAGGGAGNGDFGGAASGGMVPVGGDDWQPGAGGGAAGGGAAGDLGWEPGVAGAPGGGFIGTPGGGFIGDGGGQPGQAGPVEDLGACEQQEGWNDPGFCESQLVCEKGYAWVHCEDNGDGAWCGCERDFASLQYELRGQHADPCGAVAELCAQGASPPADAELDCQPAFAEAWPDHCSRDIQCSASAEVAPGVIAERYDYSGTYCDSYGDQWSCECFSNNHNLRVELPGGLGSPGVCDTVLDACHGDALVRSGQPTCAPRFQSADRNYCNVDLECAQDATLGDLAVKAYEFAYAYCEADPNTGGLWNCECNGYGARPRYQVNSDSGWDACSLAAKQCTPPE